MSTMADFWHMGGYGFFVWWAYAIWAAVMLWNVLQPWLRHRALTRRLERRVRASELSQSTIAQEETGR